MWVLLVPTCEVSGVQTNNCIVDSDTCCQYAIVSINNSIAEGLEFDSE